MRPLIRPLRGHRRERGRALRGRCDRQGRSPLSTPQEEKASRRSDPRPERLWILIRRIIDPGLPSGGQPLPDRRAAQTQQRPKQEHTPPLRPHWRGRPFAGRAHGRTFRPHQRRLGEVVGGVAEHHHPGSMTARGVGDQAVARRAGGGGNPGRGLPPPPGEGLKVRADAASDGFGEADPVAALRLQAMVDGQDDDPPPRPVRPGLGRQEDGEGIAAAGEGHRDRGRRGRLKATIEGVQGPDDSWRCGFHRAAQAALARASAAWDLVAALALG